MNLFENYVSFTKEVRLAVPDWNETIDYLLTRPKRTVHDLLLEAKKEGQVLVQPRCGIGSLDGMMELLSKLERSGSGDVLSLTIDSHTRLLRLDIAARIARERPQDLNGFPLIAHGWDKVRTLNESIAAPLEVRHGSPDARLLFAASLASGITSFEGGGIGYNIPYSKNVRISDSLAYWFEIDHVCGELANRDIIVDREIFGTLTAVLMPPCISLAVSFLEAILAVRAGVRCISIAYPQGGNLIQDVAALHCIQALARRYIPDSAIVHPVLHQFMGAFPRKRHNADALIILGAITGRLGNARKIINKTYQEALGVPTPEANALGMALTKTANSAILDLIPIDTSAIDEEMFWIEKETCELIDPLLSGGHLPSMIAEAFDQGRLDVPFSASRHAKSAVLPIRDNDGAIRILNPGQLPLSSTVMARQDRFSKKSKSETLPVSFDQIQEDILFFSNDTQLRKRTSR